MCDHFESLLFVITLGTKTQLWDSLNHFPQKSPEKTRIHRQPVTESPIEPKLSEPMAQEPLYILSETRRKLPYSKIYIKCACCVASRDRILRGSHMCRLNLRALFMITARGERGEREIEMQFCSACAWLVSSRLRRPLGSRAAIVDILLSHRCLSSRNKLFLKYLKLT